ncbi:MAG: flagellar hook-length control protein FliK, partial [Oscillospiraceae bacterium]
MENVSLRQVINAKLQQATGVTAKEEVGGQSFGDVWSQIFAQMQSTGDGITGLAMGDSPLAGLLGTTQTGQNAGVNDILGGIVADNQNEIDNEKTAMMQEIAAMIMQIDPQLSQQIIAQLETGNGGNVGSTNNPFANLKPQQLNELLSLSKNVTNATTDEQKMLAQQKFDSAMAEVLGYGKTTNASDLSANSLMLDANFKNAVSEAQKLLDGENSKPTKIEMIDVDALQTAVDGAKMAKLEATVPQPITQSVDMQDLIEKLKDELKLSQQGKGMQDFTVKLKPEGLGEITVKLTQGEQGVMMNITTSSESVAKMLSNQLGALQQALKPVGATVETVV